MYSASDGAVRAVLPQNCLTFLQQFVAYCETQTDAPSVFHLATGLSLLAVAMPPSAHFWGPGSPRHPNLFGMVVGGSGVSRKTSSMRIGQGIIKASKYPHFLGKTATSYGSLIDVLAEQPQQLLCDEDMAQFLRDSKGAGYLSGYKQGLLKAYDCGPLDTTSRTHGARAVAEPRLSIFGAANLTELSDHLDVSDLSSGFMSRFLIFTGTRERFLPQSQITRDEKAFGMLVYLFNRLVEGTPRLPVTFDVAANAYLDDWEAKQDKTLRGTTNVQEASLLSRIPEFSRKIALLMAVDRMVSGSASSVTTDLSEVQGTPVIVTAMDAWRALEIAKMAHASATSVLAELHFSNYMKERARVLAAIPADGGTVSLGQITLSAKLPKFEVSRHLDTLREQGLAEEVPTQDGMRYQMPLAKRTVTV